MSKLVKKDFEDFFIRAYFGTTKGDYIDLSIQRAYLDFNRTLHGISKHGSKTELYVSAKSYLKSRIEMLQNTLTEPTEDYFDSWHMETCKGLIELYHQYQYKEFYYGHGQKWVNMTLKYIFALSEERVFGFSNFIKHFHIPIDNIVLRKMKEYHMPDFFDCAWSKINKYEDYLAFQKWVRDTFPEYIPLELEFLLWLDKK